jgi:hypothetical protein
VEQEETRESLEELLAKMRGDMPGYSPPVAADEGDD